MFRSPTVCQLGRRIARTTKRRHRRRCRPARPGRGGGRPLAAPPAPKRPPGDRGRQRFDRWHRRGGGGGRCTRRARADQGVWRRLFRRAERRHRTGGGVHGRRRQLRPRRPAEGHPAGAGRPSRPCPRCAYARRPVGLAAARPGGQPVPRLGIASTCRRRPHRPGSDAGRPPPGPPGAGDRRSTIRLAPTLVITEQELDLAADAGWDIEEVAVRYLARAGRSKVTGTIRGTMTAVSDMSRVLARG